MIDSSSLLCPKQTEYWQISSFFNLFFPLYKDILLEFSTNASILSESLSKGNVYLKSK